VLLTAVNGKQQICNQSGEYLDHQTILASGNQMVDTKVAFPPSKEYLYVPSEFVNMSNFLCCQIMTTCGNPVFGIIDGVSHHSDRFFGLIIVVLI